MYLDKLVRWVFLALLLLSLFGCAAVVEERVVFPLPPEKPRLEWIGTYASEGDFRAGLTKFMVGEGGGGFGFGGVMGLGGTIDGRLLVCDVASQKLRVVDFEQKTIRLFTELAFGSVVAVATDNQGQVYVSDAGVGEILVFSPNGSLLRTIGSKEIFTKPSFLEVNSELGRVYVSDPRAQNIKVFSLSGELLFTFGEGGSEPGQFNVPQGMVFDADGQLFVADTLNARIQVFSADGEFLREFGERGTFDSQFEAPKDLAFDSEGHLYITDSRKPSFRVFDPDGTLLLVIGGKETTKHKLGFTLPTGIYVDGSDRVYVGDLINARVTVWQYLSASYLQRTQPQ